MNSILLVDDELMLSTALKQTLQHFGYHVELAFTVESAQELAEKTEFDAILVDLNLKSESSERASEAYGTGLVRQLRAAHVNVPILMFTVLENEFNEMACLDAGADEYILKTISVPRLLARLQANIRRHDRDLGKKPSTARWIGVGQFKLDREQRIFAAGGKAIELTHRETKIIEILAQNPARIVPATELLDTVWGNDLRKSPSALEGVLHRLREKLRGEQVQDLIENVRGKGYRLMGPRVALSS